MENYLSAKDAFVITQTNQINLILEGVKMEAAQGKRNVLFSEEITSASHILLKELGYETTFIPEHTCYKITW